MNDKKNIWILNHYATGMFINCTGRHYALKKYLGEMGYNVTAFASNVYKDGSEEIEIKNFYEEKEYDGGKVVLVKSPAYKGNGAKRIKNMLAFALNLYRCGLEYANYNKPDVILASSVHPFTLVAGLKIAKRLNIPCICEVRDLWPETFVEFGMIKRTSLIAKILYMGERWIYKKADQLIFTMPGGKDYIIDKGWEKSIDLKKVHNANNGIDISVFNFNRDNYIIKDFDLKDKNTFKVVYAGSIRAANQVDVFVDIAAYYKEQNIKDIKFIIYGDGDHRERIEKRSQELELDNIIFKGRVDNKYIANILSSGDLNIVTDKKNNLGHYGVSWNKLFEYMASGKPTIANYDMGKYNIIEENKIGVCKEFETIEDFAKEILRIKNMNESDYNEMCHNATEAANKYKYSNLAKDVDYIINLALNK